MLSHRPLQRAGLETSPDHRRPAMFRSLQLRRSEECIRRQLRLSEGSAEAKSAARHIRGEAMERRDRGRLSSIAPVRTGPCSPSRATGDPQERVESRREPDRNENRLRRGYSRRARSAAARPSAAREPQDRHGVPSRPERASPPARRFLVERRSRSGKSRFHSPPRRPHSRHEIGGNLDKSLAVSSNAASSSAIASSSLCSS